LTIWALIPLITCLSYIVLFVLTLPYIRRRINKRFASFLAVSAFWSFTSFMLHLNAFPRQALLWNELLVVALVGTLITYYHFIRAYTNRPAGWGTYIGYTLVMVMAVLCLNGQIVQYAYVIDGVLHHSLGISLYFIGAVSLTFIGAVIVHLIKRYRSATEQAERNRTMYLMIGWAILIIGAYTNLIPAVAGLPLDHIGSLTNAVIIAYAIGRYRLLDIRVVVRKGLIYSSLTILFTAVYLLLILVLQMFLHSWAEYTSLALAAGFALLVIVALNPLRNFIQRWIDRLFYRETYDYRRILFSFSDRISNVIDLSELAQSILEPVIQAMHVRKAALLFPENESVDFTTRFAQQVSEEELAIKLRFSDDSSLVSWLTSEGKALRWETIGNIPQLKGLWESERYTLEALGVELLCPIRSKGKLAGILVLGKKQSDARYSDDEVDLLMTMANEAAVAIENARMLDSLKSEQRRVEELLAQAVLAQEEERQRISVDLHDSVAQWLVAASYRAQTCDQVLSGDNNDAARTELTAMEKTITKSLKELRRVVIGLRPPALDELGLTHALRQSLEELKAEGLDCKFSQMGGPRRLPSRVEIAVYRIVQEALANIRKHASASRVNLRLHFQDDKLLVEIRDNGRGFDLSQTLGSAISVGHVGLLGMKQRAEMLGGDVRIRTSEGAGTSVVLSLPIQPRPEGG